MMAIAIGITPAFASTSYPIYDACDTLQRYSNDHVTCSPSLGNAFVISQPDATQHAGEAASYLYASVGTVNSGHTVKISSISANVRGSLHVHSGDTSAEANIAAYVSDPGCSSPWRCSLGSQGTTSLYSNTITSGFANIVNSALTASDKTYSISSTNTYYVVAYVDAQSVGTSTTDTYSDFSNVNGLANFVKSFSITATVS